MEENQNRLRMNAKHTAKGQYQLDITVETHDLKENSKVSAARVAERLKAFEHEMKLAGFVIAGEGK